MATTFDQRLNSSMRDISLWTQSPPRTNIDGVDIEARNAVVALQAQIQALHAVNKVATDMLGRLLSPEVKAEFLRTLDNAQEIREPKLSAFDEVDFEEDAAPVRKSGRRERKPKAVQPASLTEWFNKLGDAIGLPLRHDQVLYRHARFEQPKIILLPSTDAHHQKVIDWAHSNVLDYAFQYGTEEGTEQHWLYLPLAALSDLGLALPDWAKDELTAG